jgi:hypothetical protein
MAVSSWMPILTLSNIAESVALLISSFTIHVLLSFLTCLMSFIPTFIQLLSLSNSMQVKQIKAFFTRQPHNQEALEYHSLLKY